MKKIYFTLFTLCASLVSVTAQTLTATNHNPVIGEILRTTDASTVSVSPGASGAGQTWNFSGVTINTVIASSTVVTTASTGSASAFPSAGLAISSATNNNSFYSGTATEYSYWGGNQTIGAFNLVLTYTSAAINAVYPMSLNTTSNVTTGGGISVAGNSGSFSGNSNIVADGTGTLVLPGRTFNNVLRVKNTQNINFTLLVSGVVNQVTYEYYEPTLSKIPLFSIAQSTLSSIAFGTSTQVAVYVNADYMQVGIKEQSKEVASLNIFPNPAKSSFNISLTNEKAETVNYEIMNALGQTVKRETLSTDKGEVKYAIDINSIPSGVYFVKVNVGNATSVKKLTIQ